MAVIRKATLACTIHVPTYLFWIHKHWEITHALIQPLYIAVAAVELASTLLICLSEVYQCQKCVSMYVMYLCRYVSEYVVYALVRV